MSTSHEKIFTPIFNVSLDTPENHLTLQEKDDISRLADVAYSEAMNAKSENVPPLVWHMRRICDDIGYFVAEARREADRERLRRKIEQACFSAVHTREIRDALSYRYRMPVKQALQTISDGIFPICPRCKTSFDRDYTNYCANCGQRLWWRAYKHAELIDITEKTRNPDT